MGGSGAGNGRGGVAVVEGSRTWRPCCGGGPVAAAEAGGNGSRVVGRRMWWIYTGGGVYHFALNAEERIVDIFG